MGYWILIAAVIFLSAFGYGYWLVDMIKWRILHFLPLYLAVIPIIFAIEAMLEPPGYFDFRALIAVVLALIALLLVLGWLAGRAFRRYKWKSKNSY